MNAIERADQIIDSKKLFIVPKNDSELSAWRNNLKETITGLLKRLESTDVKLAKEQEKVKNLSVTANMSAKVNVVEKYDRLKVYVEAMDEYMTAGCVTPSEYLLELIFISLDELIMKITDNKCNTLTLLKQRFERETKEKEKDEKISTPTTSGVPKQPVGR